MSDHLKVVLATLSNVANLVAVAVAVTTRAEVINEMNMFGLGLEGEGARGIGSKTFATIIRSVNDCCVTAK